MVNTLGSFCNKYCKNKLDFAATGSDDGNFKNIMQGKPFLSLFSLSLLEVSEKKT